MIEAILSVISILVFAYVGFITLVFLLVLTCIVCTLVGAGIMAGIEVLLRLVSWTPKGEPDE